MGIPQSAAPDRDSPTVANRTGRGQMAADVKCRPRCLVIRMPHFQSAHANRRWLLPRARARGIHGRIRFLAKRAALRPVGTRALAHGRSVRRSSSGIGACPSASEPDPSAGIGGQRSGSRWEGVGRSPQTRSLPAAGAGPSQQQRRSASCERHFVGASEFPRQPVSGRTYETVRSTTRSARTQVRISRVGDPTPVALQSLSVSSRAAAAACAAPGGARPRACAPHRRQ